MFTPLNMPPKEKVRLTGGASRSRIHATGHAPGSGRLAKAVCPLSRLPPPVEEEEGHKSARLPNGRGAPGALGPAGSYFNEGRGATNAGVAGTDGWQLLLGMPCRSLPMDGTACSRSSSRTLSQPNPPPIQTGGPVGAELAGCAGNSAGGEAGCSGQRALGALDGRRGGAR